MSLGVSPSATPPLLTRPPPPARSKRRSLLGPKGFSVNDDGRASGMEGVMGGLRERSDEEVLRASRDALEHALKEAWGTQDTLQSRIENVETARDQLISDSGSLEQIVNNLQTRYDEALNEQGRLEADIQSRDELLGVLRNRLSEAERQLREAVKRASEQERSFEAERQALQAQETHLQQRIRSLLSAKSRESLSTESVAPISDLQDELASLNISHSTLVAQLNTLSKENHELKVTNRTVTEENQGWEFLLRERTFSGKVLEGGLLGSARDQHSYSPMPMAPREQSQFHALDEEMEMDELHSDLDAQSPIFDDEHLGEIRDLDTDTMHQSRLSISPDEGHLRPPRRRRPKGENLGDLPVTGSGLDLAAELGRAEIDLEGSEMRVLGKGDEGEALRVEVKQLREENKALTLYCSKIIDRIIAQEGFEHILSVDYKTRRMGSRLTSSVGRGNLKDITNTMKAEDKTVPIQSPPVKSEESKKPRPLSLMAKALSKTGGDEVHKGPDTVAAREDIKQNVETRTEKRARRGFSLDFRALGFGSSSPATTPTEQKPNPALKPLTLVSRTEGVSSSSSKSGHARRLERQEEDEEDKKERHRLEVTMRLIGVDRNTASPSTSASPSTFSDCTPKTTPPSRKLTKAQPRPDPKEQETRPLIQSRRGSGSISPEGGFRNGTPLTRLSSVLRSVEPASPRLPLEGHQAGTVSPELAAEVLAKFDQKEAEQISLLSKGKATAGYTSPSPGSIRRQSRRTASGSERDKQRLDAKVEVPRARESGSISTLWSLGSSRPVSMEFVAEPKSEGS